MIKELDTDEVLLAMKHYKPVNYMEALRKQAPNGTSLLTGENNAIFVQFPAFMELPDLMISLLEQDTHTWKWISLGNNQEYEGVIKFKGGSEKPSDEEFYEMSEYLALNFWKQARKQMRFK